MAKEIKFRCTIIVNTYDIFLLTTFSIGLKPIIIPGMSDSGKNSAITATTQTKKPSVQTGLFLLFAVNELNVDLFVVERQQTLEEYKIIPLAPFQPVQIAGGDSGAVGGLFKAHATRQAFFPQHQADAAADGFGVNVIDYHFLAPFCQLKTKTSLKKQGGGAEKLYRNSHAYSTTEAAYIAHPTEVDFL